MKTRVISAVIAAAIVIAVFATWRLQGLYSILVIGGLLCIREFSRLVFGKLDVPTHLRFAFFSFTALIMAATALDKLAISAVAIAPVFFFTMALLSVRRAEDLPGVLHLSSLAATGFLYCGVFSGLIIRLVGLDRGVVWFFGLLAIVFAGDTFAYLTGRFFGRTKLLEPVSPKKTIEGSIGGLAGSALVGAALALLFLPQLPLGWIVLTALATGVFAQVGDLFESLLKRVAEVKDSGTLMPGHGGILDRIDGVLFAAPVYFILARFMNSLLNSLLNS